LRIRDGEDTIISLRFDEATQTFSLLNETKDEFAKAFAAGSSNSLQTAQVTLDLAGTSVKGSGPTGPSITLNLALSFKPQAAAQPAVCSSCRMSREPGQDFKASDPKRVAAVGLAR
jgi:hypothetical protein